MRTIIMKYYKYIITYRKKSKIGLLKNKKIIMKYFKNLNIIRKDYKMNKIEIDIYLSKNNNHEELIKNIPNELDVKIIIVEDILFPVQKNGSIIKYSDGNLVSKKIKNGAPLAKKYFPKIYKKLYANYYSTKVIEYVNEQLKKTLNKLKYYDDFKIEIELTNIKMGKIYININYELIMVQEEYITDNIIDVWNKLQKYEKKQYKKIVSKLINETIQNMGITSMKFNNKN